MGPSIFIDGEDERKLAVCTVVVVASMGPSIFIDGES